MNGRTFSQNHGKRGKNKQTKPPRQNVIVLCASSAAGSLFLFFFISFNVVFSTILSNQVTCVTSFESDLDLWYDDWCFALLNYGLHGCL